MTLAPPFVKASAQDGVLRLTMSRPEHRNPLSMGMLGALNTEIEAAMNDPAVHVIVLAAEGPAFCAGHDLKELTAARSAPDAGAAFFRETFDACARLMLAIATGPKPVIAQVHAMATAAGCQLVAACDVAIAADTAQFATPGVNIGLFCSTPAVPLIRTMGPKRARQMLFTGEPISAAAALDAGLLSEVTSPEDLAPRVTQLARTIASKPPAVVSFGKSTLLKQENLDLISAYDIASKAMIDNLFRAEARTGIASFLSRKSANTLK
jgi:enoyl-CoA hydratase/carnithine racemase